MGMIRFTVVMTLLMGLLASSVSLIAPFIGVGAILVVMACISPLKDILTGLLGLDQATAMSALGQLIVIAGVITTLALIRLIVLSLMEGDYEAMRLRIAQMTALCVLPAVFFLSVGALSRAFS